jgi:hypothetical protein
MANKQSKFDLNGILEQITVPLTTDEKMELRKRLDEAIDDTLGKLEKSRVQQYSLNEVITEKVPYLDLLFKDIELSLLSSLQYSKKCDEQLDAFKSSFNDFAGYRRVTDNAWHLYPYLRGEKRNEVIDQACEKIKSKYNDKIDNKLLSDLVPAVKNIIDEIARDENENYLRIMGLYMYS